MRSGVCNCLALYDWRGDLNAVRFHEIAKQVFEANGVLPDIGSIARLNSEKDEVQEYSRLVADLPSLPPNLVFYHTTRGYKQIVFGWDVTACLDVDKDKTMVFCFDQELANLGLGYFESVVRTLATEVSLEYGIGYQREFDLGPDLYAYGMTTGLGYTPSDLAEADCISVWMHERPNSNRHLRGCLRDVYPLNILSSRHLSRDVGGLTLAKWIEDAPDRGYLVQVSGESWLWKVPESRLPLLRSDLRRAGCTIVSALE